MNKLSKLMMGLAALSFAACSSDEPAPTPAPGDGEGTTMYLNVRIKSADMGSRAANENSGNEEGKYDWGSDDEHTIKTADFFFFDENKIYVTQANVWNGGNESNTDENVEYISNNVLVLKGLTKKTGSQVHGNRAQRQSQTQRKAACQRNNPRQLPRRNLQLHRNSGR